MSFETVLDKYRTVSYSERDKGSRFEELIGRYLMTDPAYANQLDRVWTWMDFPYRNDFGGRDTGIDLVARTKTGEYWAVQCKCYSEDHSVTKGDMDTFISTSGRTFKDDGGETQAFSLRTVVATTDNWSSNALEVTRNQGIPVTIISLGMLRSAQVDWDSIEEGVHGEDARTERHHLRPHQKEAVDAARTHIKNSGLPGSIVIQSKTGKIRANSKVAAAKK